MQKGLRPLLPKDSVADGNPRQGEEPRPVSIHVGWRWQVPPSRFFAHQMGGGVMRKSRVRDEAVVLPQSV